MEILMKILKDVLNMLYQFAGSSVIVSFAVIISIDSVHQLGFKRWLLQWNEKYKKEYGRLFWLMFYIMMIIYRTLLCRTIGGIPTSNVMGVWGLYDEAGNLSLDGLENLALFIPFAVLLLYYLSGRREYACGEMLVTGVRISFLFSCIIELIQLFLKVGSFQLSDITYNTVGGLCGSIIYCLWAWMRKIGEKNDGKKHGNESCRHKR